VRLNEQPTLPVGRGSGVRAAPPAPRTLPAIWAAVAAIGAAVVMTLVAWRADWPAAPGAGNEPIRAARPTYKLDNGRIEVTTRVTSRITQPLRGWFLLAGPSDPEPWQRFGFKSTVIEQTLPAGKEVTFRWNEPLSVPDGAYEVTIWFHQQAGDQWVHALGGAFGSDPFTVNGAPPRLQQLYGGAVATLEIPDLRYESGTLRATVQVHPAPGVEKASVVFDLRATGKPESKSTYIGRYHPVTFGAGSPEPATIQIDDRLAVPRGTYDLWLTADSGVAGSQPQRALYRAAVTQKDDPPYVRPVDLAGPFRLGVSAAPPAFRAGQRTMLRLAVTPDAASAACRVAWRILLPDGAEAAKGEGGPCAEASVDLPATVPPGRYTLEVKGIGQDVVDSILIPVQVGP
jgi:hypothetical protein